MEFPRSGDVGQEGHEKSGETTGETQSPIELTGNELGDFPDTPEGYAKLQDAALKHLESLKGEYEFNKSIEQNVFIRASGNKKIARLGSSRIKLKLAPATRMLIRYAVRQDKKPSTDKSERNIKAYLYMKVVANVGNETANVWMSFKEDDNGAFLYEEFVNKKAMSGIARVTSTP